MSLCEVPQNRILTQFSSGWCATHVPSSLTVSSYSVALNYSKPLNKGICLHMFSLRSSFKISKIHSHKNCFITFLEMSNYMRLLQDYLLLITVLGLDIQDSNVQKAVVLFFKKSVSLIELPSRWRTCLWFKYVSIHVVRFWDKRITTITGHIERKIRSSGWRKKQTFHEHLWNV